MSQEHAVQLRIKAGDLKSSPAGAIGELKRCFKSRYVYNKLYVLCSMKISIESASAV